MRLIGILCLAFASIPVSGEQLPDSLEKWKEQANFFWALDFTDERDFRSSLKSYYEGVYSGHALNEMVEWIASGSLESEYYASHYRQLNDISIETITDEGAGEYDIKAIQNSCYRLDYDPPRMESIVADFKVMNMSQLEVNHWVKSLDPHELGEICLKVERDIAISIDQDDGRIRSEEWKIVKSTLELIPNK